MDITAQIKDAVITLFQILFWYIEALYRLFVPPSMKSIDGEVILVTGAAGGIGRELCKYIVQCGNNIKLVLWDLNIGELNKLAEELKPDGGSELKIFCYEVDISSRKNVDFYCKLVKEEVEPVTIIFNNAGVASTGNFLQLSNEEIDKTFQVNLMSQLWIIRQLLPDMVTKNHGRIVNICSITAIWAGSHAFPYFSSKFAMNGYTESLKVELALFKCSGIHCTTVYPNFVQTPLLDSLTTDDSSSWVPLSATKFLEPRDVAIKTVDGMRRQYEYIYLPAIIPLLQFTEYFIPNKLRKLISVKNAQRFKYKDAEEQKKFDAPFQSKI